MTFCPEEKISLAQFLFRLSVYSNYCWDRKGPPNPTVTQSWHHCRASSITLYNSYSLGLCAAAFAWGRKLSDSITRRRGTKSCWKMNRRFRRQWEKSTGERDSYIGQMNKYTEEDPPDISKRPNPASLIKCKSLLLPGLIAAHPLCWVTHSLCNFLAFLLW